MMEMLSQQIANKHLDAFNFNTEYNIIHFKVFTVENSILFYFTVSKSYFINYTILFYNMLNILTFILPY